jgi:hypothetical protein
MKKRKLKNKKNISRDNARKKTNKVIIFLVTIIIIPCIISYIFFYLQKKDDQGGYLLEGSLERKPVDPEERFTVQLGQFVIMASYNDLVNGINLRKWVNIGYDYPINIKIDNGNLLVTASFNDKSGKLIAQIVDNNWTINKDNYCDRNFSTNALEVVDANKVPLLQVDIKTGNNIFIGGVFYFPNIRLFMSSSDSTLTGDPTFDDEIALKKIKRIFKYPSTQYLGVKDIGI